MAFDRQAALAAGYTEDEIDAFLAQPPEKPLRVTINPVAPTKGFDVEGAKAAGYTDEEIEEFLASAPASPDEVAAMPETSAGGLAAALTRGAAPTAAGAAAGALLGLPFAGVGAVPGALAGAAAGTLTGVVGDPLVRGANALFGTEMTEPTVALNNLLTSLGIEEADSEAERVVQAGAAAGSSGAGGMALGQLLKGGGAVAQGVGQTLTTQPALQTGAAIAGGAAGQMAAETGVGGLGQTLAEIGAGLTVAGVPNAISAAGRRIRLPEEILTVANLGLDPAQLRGVYDDLTQALGRRPSLGEVLGPQAESLRRTMALTPDAAPMLADKTRTVAKVDQKALADANRLSAKDAQAIIDNAAARADVEFAPYRDMPVTLSPTERIFVEKNILETPGALGGLKAADQERIKNAIASGEPITGGDLDLMRRALRKQSRSDMGATFSALANDVEEIITRNIPGSSRAVRNYARRMSRAEGSDIGRTALSAGRTRYEQDLLRAELSEPTGLSAAEKAAWEQMSPKDRGRLARRGGGRLGLRAEIVDRVDENIGAAYALAARMETDSSVIDNIRKTMSPQEAEEFIGFMRSHKQAMDNLAALTGITPQQLPAAMDTAKDGVDLTVMALAGAGGAMQSSWIVRQLNQRLGIGRGPAKRLTEMLLDPNRTEQAIKLLEREGIPEKRLAAALRGSLIAVAVSPGSDPQEEN